MNLILDRVYNVLKESNCWYIFWSCMFKRSWSVCLERVFWQVQLSFQILTMSASGTSLTWIKFLNNIHCHPSWLFFRNTWPSFLTLLLRYVFLSAKWRHRIHFWGCRRGDLCSDGLAKDIDGFVSSYFSSSYAQYTELNTTQNIRGKILELDIVC